MSNVTGYGTIPFITREAGEDLSSGIIGAVKTSDQKIYKADDAAGYNMAGLIKEDVDSGERATLTFEVAWVDNSGTHALTSANIGAICYVEDEYTVTSTASVGSGLIAGRVLNVDATKGVLVDFNAKAAVAESAT